MDGLIDKVLTAIASGDLPGPLCADDVVRWARKTGQRKSDGTPYAEATLQSILSNSDARFAGSPGRKVLVSLPGTGRPKRYRQLREGEAVVTEATAGEPSGEEPGEAAEPEETIERRFPGVPEPEESEQQVWKGIKVIHEARSNLARWVADWIIEDLRGADERDEEHPLDDFLSSADSDQRAKDGLRAFEPRSGPHAYILQRCQLAVTALDHRVAAHLWLFGWDFRGGKTKIPKKTVDIRTSIAHDLARGALQVVEHWANQDEDE